MKNDARIGYAAFLLGLAALSLFTGCSLVPRSSSHPSGQNAFIAYWPPADGSGRLRLAIKDNIDMRGVVTTVGSEHKIGRAHV